MEKANLCTCNKCGNIFIDHNSQVDAKIYEVDTTKVTDLLCLKDKEADEKDELSGGKYFWGCGICETDGYLSDEVDEKKAKELGIINL
jgi:hypothetical protein